MSTMSLTNWLNSQHSGQDVDLDSCLQQYIVELQGSGPTTAQATPADLHSLWLPTNNQSPYEFDTAQPICSESTMQNTHFPGLEQLVPLCPADDLSQEQQDAMHHSSTGSGIAISDSRPTASSNKRSEAWVAKNRRAQKKFREKQKARLSCNASVVQCAMGEERMCQKLICT